MGRFVVTDLKSRSPITTIPFHEFAHPTRQVAGLIGRHERCRLRRQEMSIGRQPALVERHLHELEVVKGRAKRS